MFANWSRFASQVLISMWQKYSIIYNLYKIKLTFTVLTVWWKFKEYFVVFTSPALCIILPWTVTVCTLVYRRAFWNHTQNTFYRRNILLTKSPVQITAYNVISIYLCTEWWNLIYALNSIQKYQCYSITLHMHTWRFTQSCLFSTCISKKLFAYLICWNASESWLLNKSPLNVSTYLSGLSLYIQLLTRRKKISMKLRKPEISISLLQFFYCP